MKKRLNPVFFRYLEPPEMPPLWAVFDPDSASAALWRPCLGGDALRLACGLKYRPDGSPDCFLVDVPALADAQLARACRMLGLRNGEPPAAVLFDAVYFGAVGVSCDHVIVCTDPAEGRAFFAKRARKEG